MSLIEEYLSYLKNVRRYSPATVLRYGGILSDFAGYAEREGVPELKDALKRNFVRGYEIYLLEEKGEGAHTVGLSLSAVSGLCRFLMKKKILSSNPVREVHRPSSPKRIPVFFRDDSMKEYFASTSFYGSREAFDVLRASGSPLRDVLYRNVLERLIINLLYCTGMRRSEIISVDVDSLDLRDRKLRVVGKGDKMRIIPLTESLCGELGLYLETVEGCREGERALLLTPSGRRLYPVYVDRAVKSAMAGVPGVTGRKSPHVLRHTIATQLLSDGADINSIKEFLGHSSVAATQIYTHSTVEQLCKVYRTAHPRAKDNGGEKD